MDINKKILEIGKRAKEASYDLALLGTAQKNQALRKAAENIKKNKRKKKLQKF